MHFERDVREICRDVYVKKINAMKRTYHLCLSAGEEVMFRDREDFNRGFNCFALALYKTDSTGLVESFMTNHTHQMIESRNPAGFMHCFRQPYSKYFNCKYGRKGMLGEERHFALEIRGLYHKIAAVTYTLRNPLHHGIAPIPYAYPFCSVNAIFQKEMGKHPCDKLLPEKAYYRYIGKRAEYPSHYKMSKEGVFLRESVLDIVQIENLFVTPRNFDYHMGRKTSEDWYKEQEKDKSDSPTIRLETIEKGINLQSVERMLIHESGRSDYDKMADMELCRIIDNEILPDHGRKSVYELSMSEKTRLADYLYRTYHLGEAQIRRCLAMLY